MWATGVSTAVVLPPGVDADIPYVNSIDEKDWVVRTAAFAGDQSRAAESKPLDFLLIFGRRASLWPDQERREGRYTRMHSERLVGAFEYRLAVTRNPTLFDWHV